MYFLEIKIESPIVQSTLAIIFDDSMDKKTRKQWDLLRDHVGRSLPIGLLFL